MDEEKKPRAGNDETGRQDDLEEENGSSNQSYADAWKARREGEKANRDPSLYQELFAKHDEDGNERPPIDERFRQYTEKQVRKQQNIDYNMETSPVSSHTFLTWVGVVVILILLVFVMAKCNGM